MVSNYFLCLWLWWEVASQQSVAVHPWELGKWELGTYNTYKSVDGRELALAENLGIDCDLCVVDMTCRLIFSEIENLLTSNLRSKTRFSRA